MAKKTSLRYELYGSSAGAGKKGFWRWAIFAGPLIFASFGMFAPRNSTVITALFFGALALAQLGK